MKPTRITRAAAQNRTDIGQALSAVRSGKLDTLNTVVTHPHHIMVDLDADPVKLWFQNNAKK